MTAATMSRRSALTLDVATARQSADEARDASARLVDVASKQRHELSRALRAYAARRKS